MKHWAVFYRAADNGYVEACGDRSVLQIDARLSQQNMNLTAKAHAERYGLAGYRLARGDNLLNLFYLQTRIQPVAPKEPSE